MNTNSMLPPLPQIDDVDLLLEVHTHRDLKPHTLYNDTRWGDTERLADLGAKVLDMVVTFHFFSKLPCIPAGEIATKRQQNTAPTVIHRWLDSYNLKQKYRVPPDQSEAIFADHGEMTAYFHTYVGAVYMQKGMDPIQNWISRLLDPHESPPAPRQSGQDGLGNSGSGTQNPYSSFSSPQTQHNYSPFASTSYSAPAPPAGPPPPLPTSPAPLPGTMNLVTLAAVNQTAMQKGFSINYTASSEGLSHQPTWTVRCLINNTERGIGVGKNQKLAKEEAARRAWIAMGW